MLGFSEFLKTGMKQKFSITTYSDEKIGNNDHII